MKKIVLTVAALAFSAGVALAENPNVGTPDDLYSGDKTPVTSSAPVKIIVDADGFAPAPAGSNR
ncbi:hypothetical protein [Pseudochrobactrum sp. MP213Fo]|uniref:hypothetical protein n=1 Tax=Pseudochrobactrum sp. MP213Fo TaxID=3022250 RepID=UPI003BA37C70